MSVPPSPRLGWDDKSIPVVSSLGIELEPERAAIAAMARQLIAVSPEQELEQLKEKIAAKNNNSSNADSSSSDDDDGIASETMTDVFGKVIFQRTRLVHGDMLNEKLTTKIQSNFEHLSKNNIEGLSKSYRAAVFPFCCGVAFDKETCQKIVESVLAIEQNNSSSLLTLLGGVFLFREWPYGEEQEEENDNKNKTKREYKLPESFKEKWQVQKIVLSTSWMNEAPAFLLCVKS